MSACWAQELLQGGQKKETDLPSGRQTQDSGWASIPVPCGVASVPWGRGSSWRWGSLGGFGERLLAQDLRQVEGGVRQELRPRAGMSWAARDSLPKFPLGLPPPGCDSVLCLTWPLTSGPRPLSHLLCCPPCLPRKRPLSSPGSLPPSPLPVTSTPERSLHFLHLPLSRQPPASVGEIGPFEE